jgi:hypothetical protein
MAELKLNDLTRYNRRDLDEMFLAAKTPTMEEMTGTLDGKVLAGTALLSNRVLRWFLSLSWVPSKGKSFEPLDGGQGRGINRFRVGPLRTTRYRFETEISPPLVGEDDVYRLNYDLRGNPWFVRLIRDDIKKLRDGLFLGTANRRTKSGHKFVIYFALESVDQ